MVNAAVSPATRLSAIYEINMKSAFKKHSMHVSSSDGTQWKPASLSDKAQSEAKRGGDEEERVIAHGALGGGFSQGCCRISARQGLSSGLMHSILWIRSMASSDREIFHLSRITRNSPWKKRL